ncbi:MAG: replication initiation factor domain-containing protein [Colwellia sp.]|nr:replication initiation factor domain-containing protein [Colwellia sp.]
MKPVIMNQPFKPTQITTGSYLETITSYKVNESNEFSFDGIGYLIQTHCPDIQTEKGKSLIDLVKVVFPIKDKKQIIEVKHWLSIWLREIGISISTTKATLRHHSHGLKLFPLDESRDCCGSLKWDENKGTLQLELTGAGCSYVNVSQRVFLPVYALLTHFKGKITEVDIAVDDYTGKFNLRYFQKAFSAGDYKPKRGQPPTRNPKGKYPGTEYLGNSGSHKSMCIYEKWRELGLPKSHPLYKLWTRHELTLRRKSKHLIGLDVLTHPDCYFVSAYEKVHRRIIQNVKPRSVVREKSVELTNSLSKSVAYCKYSYGRIIAKVAQLVGDDGLALRIMGRKGSPTKFLLPRYLDEIQIKENSFDGDGTSFNEDFIALVEGHNPLLKKGRR